MGLESFSASRGQGEESRVRKLSKTRALLGSLLLGSIAAGSAEASSETLPVQAHRRAFVTRGEGVAHVTEEGYVFQPLHRAEGFSWAIEYVPRKKDGQEFFAERLVKTNEKSGKRVVLGEFESLFDAAKAVGSLSEVPQEVRAQIERDAAPVQTEKMQQDTLRARGIMASSHEVDAQ